MEAAKTEEQTTRKVDESIEREKHFAAQMGLTRLGRKHVWVKTYLTDQEKIDAGERVGVNEIKLVDLSERKKAFNDTIKAESSALREEIMLASQHLKHGYREENKELPCFYDHTSHERVFFNLETGEEVKRERAEPEDRQLRLAE